MAQARETKEELKVKELLILDLTKKQQETEFRLSFCKERELTVHERDPTAGTQGP